MQTQWLRKFKVDYLHRRIQELDEAIAQLNKERGQFLEELNDVEPPISILPSEVLRLIFAFSRPSRFPSYNAGETTSFCGLTRVSKHWRSVLLSYPALWNQVDLDISHCEPKRDAKPLRPFILHSGQLPLFLSIHYSHDFFAHRSILIHRSFDSSQPSVDQFLLKNLDRVTRLSLQNPPAAWFLRHALFGRITHLYLSEIHTPVDLPLSLDQAVSLTVNNSPGVRLTSAPLITTLKLRLMPISSSFRIITSCPNLKKLTLICREKANDPGPGFPIRPFILQFLEVLHWGMGMVDLVHDEWYVAVLDHIRLPSLQTLKWEECKILREYEPVGRAIARFFTRLPPTLTSLKFLHTWSSSDVYDVDGGMVEGECMEDARDVHHFPPIDSHLESIEFNYCSIFYFLTFLQKLQDPQQFPQLHTIKAERLQWNLVAEGHKDEECALYEEKHVLQACSTMLLNRANVLGKGFTLVLGETNLGWWRVRNELKFKFSSHQMEIFRASGITVLNA